MRSVDPMVNALANPVSSELRGAKVPGRSALRSQHAENSASGRDVIDLSDVARNKLASGDQPVRADLVNRVRAEIASGNYESKDKLDVLVDRLHRELFGA